MNPKFRIPLLCMVLFVGIFIFVPQLHAAKPIATISGFTGDVIVQTDVKIVKLTATGLKLNTGDRVQTRQGEAQITFDDGAVMKLRPFSNVMIEQRVEESGFWFFKAKNAVRRVTCFIGKVWFKSGESKRKNFLQTPTAVCGIRGSEGEIAFDNLDTYLQMYVGEADVMGEAIRAIFSDDRLNVDLATKSEIYDQLEKAYEATQKAEATGNAVDLANATYQALQVVKSAATVLQGSPDPTVQTLAGEAGAAADTRIQEVTKELEDLGAPPPPPPGPPPPPPPPPPAPPTQTTEQEVYQEEASPSQ